MRSPNTSVQNRHIYTHIWQFVEKNVVIVAGEACYNDGRAHGLPIRSGGRFDRIVLPGDVVIDATMSQSEVETLIAGLMRDARPQAFTANINSMISSEGNAQ